MNTLYLRAIVQFTYFTMVLIIKILDGNSEYFQVIFSLILTLLQIPLNKFIADYVEHSQLVCKSLWQVLNLFCLGSVDVGLKGNGLLSRFQYFWLGLTIQLDVDSLLPHKIVRIGYVLVVIAAVNLTAIYLLMDSTWTGMICGEILYALLLCYQLLSEQQQVKSVVKKPSSRSFTDKVESPQPQLFDEESNQVYVQSLSQGIRHPSLHSRDPSVREQIEQQKNFYKILFNQFPEGILIINDQNNIEYHNNQIYTLLGRKQMQKDQILQRLYELKNYSAKFQYEEQAQFDKMFSALNKKLKSVSHEFEQQFRDDSCIESYQKANYDDNLTDFIDYESELSKAESLRQEIEKALIERSSPIYNGGKELNRQASQLSQRTIKGQEKIKFLSEVKMLCMIEESSGEDMAEIQDEQEENSGLLIQVTIKPYLYDQRRSILLMIRDVTLFNQFKVLQQQNSNKSKMLSQVAHELRNPLGAIKLISQQLIEKIQDKEITQKFLKPLQFSAESLSRLLNDLLDLAQLKAGKFKLTFQEFGIKTFLIDAVGMMAFQVNSKKLDLSLKFDTKIPQNIKSDQQRIQQILLNLINNSTKFTQEGGITVQATLIQPRLIEIAVEDTGLGILPEDIQKLFKPFGKLEDNKNLNTQGVGLGLMISNVLAQKLSGNDAGLKVESKGIGQGTRFSFKIQDQNELKNESYQRSSIHNSQDTKYFGRKESNMSIVYVQKMPIREPSQPMSGSKFRSKVISEQVIEQLTNDYTIYQFKCEDNEKFQTDMIKEIDDDCQCPKVLLVDDEAVNMIPLGFIMESIHLNYEKMLSGVQCLEFLKKWDRSKYKCCSWIKFIIIDISMPGMDGYQTTKEIRKLEQTKGVKSTIIGCSGYQDDESKQLGFKHGMDYYITKPVNTAELKTILQQCS